MSFINKFMHLLGIVCIVRYHRLRQQKYTNQLLNKLMYKLQYYMLSKYK